MATESSPNVLAIRAVEAALRLGLDPSSDVVKAAQEAAHALDEAMDRAEVRSWDISGTEGDRVRQFIEGPGADLTKQAVAAKRQMLLAATGEILARKWALSGDELLFVRGIETALEED